MKVKSEDVTMDWGCMSGLGCCKFRIRDVLTIALCSKLLNSGPVINSTSLCADKMEVRSRDDCSASSTTVRLNACGSHDRLSLHEDGVAAGSR
jgi:hypothetical protein